MIYSDAVYRDYFTVDQCYTYDGRFQYWTVYSFTLSSVKIGHKVYRNYIVFQVTTRQMNGSKILVPIRHESVESDYVHTWQWTDDVRTIVCISSLKQSLYGAL